MLEPQSYHFPTSIRFGAGVSKELGCHLIESGIKKPLLVTDPQVEKLPLFRDILDKLSSKKLHPIPFSSIRKNPVKSDVTKGKELYDMKGCDAIVAIGGGASIDVARAIALLANHPGDLFDYEEAKGGEKRICNKIPHFVAIPTTSGTGSEVGRSAVIADDINGRKKILFSPHLMAKKVFVDPLLTMELPREVTAATGMDALTHHIEALFAKGFHPMCDAIASEGIAIIWRNIEKATNSPSLETRSAMMIAALMGGVAFQKGLGVVHSLAHPLSSLFDIHHGLANAVMLPHGLLFNRDYNEIATKRACEIIGENDLFDALKSLNKSLHLPTSLGELAVSSNDIEALAALAVEDPCHTNNPRPVTKEEFLSLYRAAL